MRTALILMAVTIAGAASGCSGSGAGSGAAGFSGASERPYHDHASHEHHEDMADVGAHHGTTHGAHGALATSLVAPSDLPTGYIVGAHHDQPAAAPTDHPVACRPLAGLLAQPHGDAPGERETEHPEVVTVLSKSHFGPQIMEKVIDYGTDAAADSALSELRAVLTDCSRYVHSVSAIGANTYRVQPGPRGVAAGDDISLRLTSIGRDFDGDATINWDVWSTRLGSRLLTIAFRSAPGGGNADMHEAVRVALAKQRKAP